MGQVVPIQPFLAKRGPAPKLGAVVVVPMPLKYQDPPSVGRIALREVEDGNYCSLECGCVVRKMTDSPKAYDMVNVWIHGTCGLFATRMKPEKRQSGAMCFATYPIRQLAGGVLSSNLPGYTTVTYDPLTNELASEFE